MTTAVTSAEILRHTTAFLTDVVSQRELRSRLISTLRLDTAIPIPDEAAVKLACDTLETAIPFSSADSRSFSLSLAEKLLLPLPDHHPLPSFLLSLIRTLRNRHLDAAVSLLRIFRSNPSLARSEIAPFIYDRLFSLHLLTVFRWLLERRAQILPSNSGGYSLSKVSVDQASKLRELEKDYEEILDENCRVVAARFEEVLMSKDGNRNASIDLPLPTVKSRGEGGRIENGEEEEVVVEETETTALKNGHYNNVRTMPH